MDRLTCLKVLYDRYEKSLGFKLPERAVTCKYFCSSFPIMFQPSGQRLGRFKRDVFMQSVCIGGKNYDAVYPSASLVTKMCSYVYELRDQHSLNVSNFMLFDDLLDGPCDRVRLQSCTEIGTTFTQNDPDEDSDSVVAAVWLCIIRFNPNTRRISVMPLKKLNVLIDGHKFAGCRSFACSRDRCWCESLQQAENDFCRADTERQFTIESPSHLWIDSSVYLAALFLHVNLYDSARRKIASTQQHSTGAGLYDEYPLRDIAFVECIPDLERGYELVAVGKKLILAPTNVYSSKQRPVREKITAEYFSENLEVNSRVTENAGFCTGMLSRGERYADVLRSTTEKCKSFSSVSRIN